MAAGTRSRWPRCHDRAVRVDLQTDAGRAKVGWRHVFVSAVVAAVLFELGKTDWPVSRQKRIGQFLCRNRRAGLSLAWVYYAVQILLLGASSPESMSMPMALRGMGPSQHWCSWVPTRSQLLYRRQLQHHPHPAEVTVATVARWRRLAARELPPKITLLSGVVLLRIIVESGSASGVWCPRRVAETRQAVKQGCSAYLAVLPAIALSSESTTPQLSNVSPRDA